jgi:hypothetical protein
VTRKVEAVVDPERRGDVKAELRGDVQPERRGDVQPERRGDVKPELGRILGDNQNHTRP